MLTKQNTILEYFAREPWKNYTFTELMKVSKNNSKSYLSSTLNNFVKDNIVKKEMIGRLPIYSLNIASTKARLFAGFVLEYNAWKKKNIPYKDMEKLINKLSIKNYVFIITGSYATNNQSDNSDIDVVIIIGDTAEPKRVYQELSFTCEMNIPSIHLYVFRNKEFIEMLLNKEANYGKEIVNKNIILAGGQIYIQLINEAMQHGFTNKYTY